MNPEQKMVREFHDRILGDKEMPNPHVPDYRTLLIRGRLIAEESAEFLAAASSGDLVKLVDALVDILYTVYGTADTIGIDLEPVFKEVHCSNMSKRPPSSNSGGKAVKGPDYRPPDIQGEVPLSGMGRSGP